MAPFDMGLHAPNLAESLKAPLSKARKPVRQDEDSANSANFDTNVHILCVCLFGNKKKYIKIKGFRPGVPLGAILGWISNF